jgi:hypothetical protein
MACSQTLVGPRAAFSHVAVVAAAVAGLMAAPAPALAGDGDGDSPNLEGLPPAGTLVDFDALEQVCLFQDTVPLRDQVADQGLTFRGGDILDGGGVLAKCSFFLVIGISPPNVLGFNPLAMYMDGGRPIDPQRIFFDAPTNFVKTDVGGPIEIGNPITLTAFDAEGVELASSTVELERTLQPLLVEAEGIHTAVLTSAEGTRYVADSLRFGPSAGNDLSIEPAQVTATVAAGGTRSIPLTLRNASDRAMGVFTFERPGGSGRLAGASAARGLGNAEIRVAEKEEVPGNSSLRDVRPPTAVLAAAGGGGEGGPAEPKILVFTELEPLQVTPDSDLDLALRSLGIPYTAVYGGGLDGFFLDVFATEDWDIVIFDHQLANSFTTGWLDALLGHVQGGGKLVMTSWEMSKYPEHPLWAELGATWVSDVMEPPTMFWQDAAGDLPRVPNNVLDLEQLSDFYFIDGQKILIDPAATVLAREENDDSGQSPASAIIEFNDGRTIFKSYNDGNVTTDRDGDGIVDAQELWRNVVIRMVTEDRPWLERPAEIIVPASGSIEFGVTVDTTGLAPGTYTATIEVRTDEAVFDRTSIPVTIEVVAGCPADLDGSGAVEIMDLLALLGAWGECPGGGAPCPADLDGSGAVGLTDLLEVLVSWGPCPGS